jgi:membrane protein
MLQRLKNIWSLLKTTSKNWWDREPFRESAIIAYYAVFAIPGLLVVIITIVGYFYSADVINSRLSSQITSTMGSDTAIQVQNMVEAASKSKKSILATIIGVATILVGATGVFAQFQKSLNTIWGVKADDSKSGIWRLIRVRLFSFGLIVAFAFIMMVSLVISTLLKALGDWMSSQFSDSLLLIIQVANFVVSISVISLLFAIMFKFFPDAQIKWRHVWQGSIVTTLLFLLGMNALSLYFGKAEPGDGYGAAGSIILILLWVSYSSMIVFFGAEFTKGYADLYDGNTPPDKNAVEQPESKSNQEN